MQTDNRTEDGGCEVYLARTPSPTLPPATYSIGHGLRRVHGSDISSSTFLSLSPVNQPLHPSPAFSGLQSQPVFKSYDHGVRQRSNHVPVHHGHQAHHRPAGQARRHESVRHPDSDGFLAGRVREASHPSSQHFSSANLEDAVSTSIGFQRDDPDSRSQVPSYVPPFTPHAQPSEARRSNPIPSNRAQQADPGLPIADTPPIGNSNLPGDAVNNLQVVQYGDVDPEKPWKRRDNPEDKQRKGEISKEQGACLKCKKTRKRCNGKKICNRCRKGGHDCIRTCNSCWSNKKRGCDEAVCCKNCHRAGTTCVRPSASQTETEDLQQENLAVVRLQAKQASGSSARVNKHTIQETGRQISAPTAWNTTFGIGPGLQNIDEFDVMGAASDSAHVDSRPYSQQSTDVDLRRTMTNDSSTKIASEDNFLQVPGKQHIAFDLRSEASTHFEEAMHFSDQGSPQVEDIDAYSGNIEDDALWRGIY